MQLNQLPSLLIATFALAIAPASVASGAESSWYSATPANCSDPLSITGILIDSGWFERPLNVRPGEGRVAAGHLYVALSAERFSQANQSEGHTVLFERFALKTPATNSLRNILEDKADSQSVPLAAQLLINIVPGYVLHSIGSAITSSLFTYLLDVASSRVVTTRALAEVVAEGGEIHRMLSAFRIEGGGHYVVSSFVYRVTVGEESRAYLLSSCTYPAKLEFKQIRTDGPFNNKLLSRDGEHWVIWDVEGNKYDSGTLTETHRDQEFLYFDRKGNTGLDASYRISMTGGPWQVLSDGKWKTLYAKVVAS